MPAHARFALIHCPSNAEKPTVFSGLDGLCRRIHTMRRQAPLQLQDYRMYMRDDGAEGRNVVAIYTLTESGTQDRFLGWAWLDGGSWRALQAALYAASPNTAARAEAA